VPRIDAPVGVGEAAVPIISPACAERSPPTFRSSSQPNSSLKTAKAIGLEIHHNLLVIADQCDFDDGEVTLCVINRLPDHSGGAAAWPALLALWAPTSQLGDRKCS
jgi:hypothetical protein